MFMQIREINDPIRTIMILQHPLDTLHYREVSKEEVLDIYLFPTHEILEKEGKTLTLLCAGGGRFVKKTSRKYNFPLILLPSCQGFQHSEVLICL